MAKQLNVNLAFTADTSQALQTLQQLKQNLHSISSLDISTTGISNELKSAVHSAQALEQHLVNAFNTKTGNLDLGKLNTSLKQSGDSLATLSNNLLGAGLSGEKAFLQVQSSIASANTQLIKANGLISNFMTTLKNTARWQISSSLLHGFMGAIQSAYGYSQDLNESLNNIRIVTGQNIDQMAKFAEQANKAAKALSATTTDYTNASLIYYQQGLSDEEVQKRTDVTIKMANAAGQSAETVSDQLTAVWNNFYDGTKSLEYYADVMTALGAATASSTDEIAGGLEKFAAIGETIGLSYEYAASALATITANTRQSEEVVGTALKTIFARIQGLNLGETLDDGTTLNKYSEALQKVGISIFEQNGELKDMDNILNEMGAKWQTLAKDQQTALAQTVAGVRQYTQLVALMDNWDKGDNDSMMANLQTSYNAEGTLQEQADIYEESWEAASKRVKASLETIYAEMVPDETFIDLMNGLEDVLNLVGMVVKGFGGLEGIIMLVSSMMLTKFAPNLGQALQTGIEQTAKLKQGVSEFAGSVGKGFLGNLQSVVTAFSGSAETAKSALQNTQEAARGATVEIEKQQKLMLENASSAQRVTMAFKDQVNSLKQTTDLTSLVKNNSSVLTKETSEQLLEQIKQVQVLGEKKALLLEELDIIKQENANLIEGSLGDFYDLAPEQAGSFNLGEEASQRLQENLSSVAKLTGNITLDFTSMENHMQIMQDGKLVEDFSHLEAMVEASVEQVIRLTSATDQLHAVAIDEDLGKTDKAAAMNKILAQTKGLSEATRTALQNAINAFAKDGDVKKFQTTIRQVGRDATKVAEAFGISEKNISNATQQGHKLAANTKKVVTANNEYNQSLNTTTNNIQTALAKATALGPTIAKGLSNLSSVAMSISMLSNAFDTLTDSEASFGQKLTTTTMALSMGFGSFLTIIKGVNSALTALNSTQAVTHALNTSLAVSQQALTLEEGKGVIANIAVLMSLDKMNDEQAQNILQTKLKMSADQAAALVEYLRTGATAAGSAALKDHTAEQILDTVAVNAGTQANLKYAASQLLKNKYMLIAVAILAILAAGIIAVVKAEKQRIETNKKTAESSQEAAKAAQEEADANKELIDSYYAALKAQDGTKESKDALYAAALKVAKAYGIEGAAADALAGDYENLTKKILEARKAELLGSKTSNDTAITTTSQTLLDALRKGKGHVSGSTYTGTFGTSQTAKDILKDGEYEFLSSNNLGKISFGVSDFANPEDMYAYYQEVEKLVAEYRELAANDSSINLATDKVYTQAVEELTQGKDAYNKLKELYGEQNDILLELGSYETKFGLNNTQGILDINSLAEYEEFYKNYVKYLADQKGITEENTEAYKALEQEALNYLATQENLLDYAVNAEGFKEKFGESKDYEKIAERFKELTEEERSLIWDIEVDEDTSLDDINEYIEKAQNLLNANKLNAEIQLNNELSDLIGKENKTEDDWTAIKTAFEAGNYNIDYADFLKMSQKEQQAYLEAEGSKKKNEQGNVLEGSTEDAEKQYNEAVSTRDQKQGLADQRKNYYEAQAAEYEAKKTGVANKVSDYQEKWIDYTTPTGGTAKYFTLDPSQGMVTDLDEFLKYFSDNKIFDEYTLGLYQDAFEVSKNLYANGFYQGGQNVITDSSGNEISNYGDQTAAEYLLDKVEHIANISGFEKDSDEYENFTSNLYALLNNQGGSGSYYTWEDFGGSLLTGVEAYGKHMQDYYQSNVNYNTTEAGKYEDESEGYDTAVDNTYEKYIQQLQNAQDLQAEYRKEAQDAGINLDEYEAYKELLADTSEELNNNDKALHQVAIANKKMEKGVKTLSSNWKTWNTILKDGSLEDFSTIAPEVNGAIQEILNLNDQEFALLPPDFARDNLDLIQQVVDGVDGSVEALRTKAGEEILLTIDGVVDPEGKINADIQNIHSAINSFDQAKFTIGVGIDETDTTGFFKSCQAMVDAAGMTKDQANAYFGAMGYDVEYDDNPQTAEERVIEYAYSYDYDDQGNPTYRHVEPIERVVEMQIDAPTIKTITPNGSYGGNVNVNSTPPKTSTTDTTSSGGKTSKPKEVKKEDIVDRYKEQNDQLDDISDALDDINKKADRLYGANRINALKQANKLLEQENKVLDEKAKLVKLNIEADKQRVKDKAKAASDEMKKLGYNKTIDFEFNDDNLIANYTEQMTKLYDVKKALVASYGTEISEVEQQNIDALQEKIDELREMIEQFDETREELQEIENKKRDNLDQIQDNNYQNLVTQLEVEVEIDEAELQKIDYYISKWADDFYMMAESAAKLKDSTTNYKNLLETYEGHKDRLDAAYMSKEISQADYIDGLKEVRDGIYDQLNALIELDKQMMHYYEDTLNAASEELAEFTDHMEHLTDVFDHYLNLMDILGKKKDYDAMGNFLSGKADTIKDRLDVATSYYNMLKENSKADEYWANYQKALTDGDADMATWWKEQWDAEVDALDEAQAEMLGLTEEWAEAMKSVIENNMAKISDALEKSLTNGLGFDKLMDDFDKLNTRQEEFLTKTNQIYETNKLMRTANQALDATDNKVAKQKLKNFIDETKSLQENTELSKYELEIQQAKYDLLLAEIALEEAQNAKSTVRLSQDSEGNFGYVYTADQDAVSDAQQGVEDAENNLYNISLEGQQNYTEKYLQAEQQMLEDLDEIWRLYHEEGAIDREEYNRRYADIQAQYLGPEGILTAYSKLYNIAVQTDANATADNWQKNYGNMTQNTSQWAANVNEYYQGAQGQIAIWETVSTTANENVEGALNDSETATKNLKDESTNLKNAVTTQVIPALEKEIIAVRKTTDAWADQRSGILSLISTYEDLISTINAAIAAQSSMSGVGGIEYDINADYSALMSGVEYGSDEYNLYKSYRERKLNDPNYKGNGGKASTSDIDKFLQGGNTLAGEGFVYYTDLTEEDWKKYRGTSMATGGYTGDWGPQGKLAVLHEKELVLNQKDTENLLSTISFIRELVNKIDGQASYASLTSMYASGIGGLEQVLEQTVTIHAEFPNATNHSEIEEAFNNLVNRASQYANRK